jgi:hypothetical protein
VAGVGNFVFGYLPDLIRQQGDDGERFAGEGHEFDGAALAALVDEHDRADVVLGQAMCSGKSVVNTTLSSSLIISNIQWIRRGQCSRFRVFGNKPNGAHHRRAAIGRGQRAFDHKIPSE